MNHEVLFSLWHGPSGLFKLSDKLQWLNGLELSDILHPGERKVLEKIIIIAAKYYRFEEFQNTIDDQHTSHYEATLQENVQLSSSNVENRSGLYLKAFCTGLNEVLEVYRKTILNLERTLLENPQLTVMYVLGAVEKFTTLFEYLESMICTMETEQIYGCHLIGRLHKYTEGGIENVINAANIIIKAVNTTFYKQLADWIIYGNLSDVYDEFFIADCKCDDENFLYQEQIDSEQDANIHLRKSRVRRPCRVRKFMIRRQMLPSLLPYEIAESILFMGRIVWIVQNDPSQNYGVLEEKFRRDVWGGKSLEYYRKIQALEDFPFSLNEFEPAIQECRLKLTKYLWTVMIEESHLLNHLQILRDYYALGRGELFQQFIIVAEEQLDKTQSDHTNKTLNTLFSDTARKMYGDKDRCYQKIEFFVAKKTDGSGASPLLNMEMHMVIPWPLHIVFHPEVVSLYNKLFAFLIRVKKTSIDLHLLWSNHINSKKTMDHGLWTLRHNLTFLVNNIEYYLQVDVIESHFSMFREAIQNVNEVNDIIRLHSSFLGDLLRKTFMMSINEQSNYGRGYALYQIPSINFEKPNTVYHIILLLLQLCDEFCIFATNFYDNLREPALEQLEQYQIRSDQIIETLLRALFSMHDEVSGHHLLQLLHRLDFNRWFTKSKADLNLTQS